jgi:hypothetical protein
MLNPSCRSPGFGEPRAVSGPVPAQRRHTRLAFTVFGMAPVLSVGEERGGFTGIFEIVAADKARVGRMKRRPFCAGERRLPSPINPPHPCRPNQPSHPLPDPGDELRQGTLPQPFGRPTTQRPSKSAWGTPSRHTLPVFEGSLVRRRRLSSRPNATRIWRWRRGALTDSGDLNELICRLQRACVPEIRLDCGGADLAGGNQHHPSAWRHRRYWPTAMPVVGRGLLDVARNLANQELLQVLLLAGA